MLKIANPSGEATVVVKIETSKDGNLVAGLESKDIKSYRDNEGVVHYYFEALVPKSLKAMYESEDNTQIKRDARMNRCLIPGKQKAWIRCPECNKCSECPRYADKKAGIISLDQYTADGCPEIPAKDNVEETVIYMHVIENLVQIAKEKRERLVQELKLLGEGYEKSELPEMLGISESTMYDDIKVLKDLAEDLMDL